MKNKKFWISLMALIMAVVMVLGLVLSLLPTHVRAAQSSSEIKEQIEQMQKENEALEAEKKALAQQQKENLSDIKDMIAQKTVIEQQVGLLYSQIENMNEQIAAFNVLIADKQEELDEAEQELQELNEKYKERIRAMEEDGNFSYWSVLFKATSFTDLLDRLSIVQEIAASDAKRLTQLREAAASVEAARAELLVEREELAAAKEELAATQEELLLKSAESQELLNQLTAKGEELEALMADYEEELAELEIAIGQAKLDYDAAVYAEYLATLTTAPTIPTDATGYKNKGGETKVDESGITWVVPCSYSSVTSAYGWRIHPVDGDYRFHHGVDLAAACRMKKNGTTDSPIYAARSGVVVAATYDSSAGYYVTIDHLDGYRTTYLHMCCKPFVSAGDVVGAGQVIGCIGTTGKSTGNHLHFGVFYNGSSVNPMDYIG